MQESATIRKNRIVQIEGKREVSFYNLEMILAIGYRVRSYRGTQFRQWATERLNEYLVKGFTMDDDDRLKELRNFGQDYFAELLERIRDIRASERRFYLKITDIYATTVDYDAKVEISKEFFATVQNKLIGDGSHSTFFMNRYIKRFHKNLMNN
ncbi:RhuM family protein [Bacillus sp. 2205SS5-2]|uniref:RhuM family protein n=1 Tax=Bacillus sp. 2205SS5-2 TaxID=3109031 RepID=UPI0030049826